MCGWWQRRIPNEEQVMSKLDELNAKVDGLCAEVRSLRNINTELQAAIKGLSGVTDDQLQAVIEKIDVLDQPEAQTPA